MLIIPIMVGSLLAGCATGRDMTSDHYIPEWENKVINLPAPSESSGGRWAVKAATVVGKSVQQMVLVPMAVLGNVMLNAYYVPTWLPRWLLRGDKRLIVWNPIFKVGEEVGSDFYSKKWNSDLT